jgi:hypothetical protein
MKNTLRWLSVIPLGFLAMMAVTFLMRISNFLNGPFTQNSELVISFFSSLAYSYVCGITAPSHYLKTAIGSVIVLLIAAIITNSYIPMSAETISFNILSLLGATVGVIIFYFKEG